MQSWIFLMRAFPFLVGFSLCAACLPVSSPTVEATLPQSALPLPSPTIPTVTTLLLPTQSPMPLISTTITPLLTPVPPHYVVTEFFYWYDPLTGRHIQDDPLSLSLPDGKLPDWRDPAWYKFEFEGMIAAGIDIAACGFWPGEEWSTGGLPHLTSALDALVAEGQRPPGVAIFIETLPLKDEDLTSVKGKARLYGMVHDFYTLVPQQHWGRIDGRPVIWMYSLWPRDITPRDQSTIDYVYEQFEVEFGEHPYIVLDRSWVSEQSLQADGVYTWGVAYLGFQPRDDIAGAGPGMDDHLVPGRDPPVIVSREDGAYYTRNLYYALASGRNILWLETWNEHHESTNINETQEYGRQYIDLTRQYVDWFRQGIVPPKPLGGKYASVSRVSAVLDGENGQWDGLRHLDVPGDGLWQVVEVGAKKGRSTAGDLAGRYLYFAIDDDFAFFDRPVTVTLTVEFFDQGGGELILNYDSFMLGEPDRLEDHYRTVKMARIGDSGIWGTAKVTLQDVRFANGENMGADFRLWAGENRDVTIRSVVVEKP